MKKVLIITNLFPNKAEPNRAVFNKQQFKEIAKLCELKVVAPIPYFKYSLEEVPLWEMVDGIETFHPRYLVIPKIFRSLYGVLFFFGVFAKVKKIYRSFKFDCIFSSWAYPDSFASCLIARALKKPLVIKVHGSDVNILTKYFLRRIMIVYAFRKAQKIVAVSNALKEKIIGLGISSEKIEVIPNGVNTSLFKVLDKKECRKKLNLSLEKKIVLYVGNLEHVKGIDILVNAMEDVPSDIHLFIIGDGSLNNSLKCKVESLKLKKRVSFFGVRPHHEIPIWMNAADVYCLPSRNEGCPNVVLEALSCGKRVVAARVGDISEILTSGENGILVYTENHHELAQGIIQAFKLNGDGHEDGKNNIGKRWAESAEAIFKLF